MSDSTENTSKPSREQLEARVVAMLLGEASPFEEEQLREQLKGDAALAKFCAEIKQTLPLLNEALDVGQASKAKSPKPRLARKRRGKLKLLFLSDTGLAKRRIVRLDFRKALAIAAAVCVVLFVAAGLLLPSLAEVKARFTVAANSNSLDRFGAPAEAEMGFQATITTMSDYDSVKVGQVVNETAPTATPAPTAKSNSSFKRGSAIAGVDFLADRGVHDRGNSLSNGDPFEPVGGDKVRLAAATATDPVQGLGFGEVNGKKVADGLVVESRTESTRSGGRVRKSSGRGLADLALPELKSDDLAASSDNYANFGTVPGGGGKTGWEGRTRSLPEFESMRIEEAGKPGFSKQKNLATQLPQPATPPVPMFESGYSESVNELTPQPSDGGNLYWFKRETNPGAAPVTTSWTMSNGLVNANGSVPSTEAATKLGTTTFSDGSLYSISEAKPKRTVEKFKRPKVSGQEVPPIPQAGAKGIAVDGREHNWQFGYAYKSGVDPGANASMRGQALPNWDIPVPDEAAKQQWGVTRGDNTTAENRKQPSPFGDTAGMAGYGGMTGMGGRGGRLGGMEGGGFGGYGAPEGVVAGQPMGFVGAPVAAVTGGVVEAFTLSVDKDGDDRVGTDEKLSEVAQGQAANGLPKGFGKQNNRRFAGRSTVESIEGESAELGQAVRFAAPVEVAGKPVSELRVRGFGEDKSLQLGKVVERDQSGSVELNLERQLNQPEGGQAGILTLGDTQAFDRIFKKQIKPEKSARELGAVQIETTDDSKAPHRLDRLSRESGRQSQSQLKEDDSALSELPTEVYESLVESVDEAVSLSGLDRLQELEENQLDVSHGRTNTRKPQSASATKRELLLQKGKRVANRKVPVQAKPNSAERLSRLNLAKREENLKELAHSAKPPTPSVVYTPRPETVTAQNNFSTFSLNVSDVSFKTTLASLQASKLPEPGDVRSEEFLNALEYRDPMPRPGEPLAFHWERARSPFTHDRDIIRFSVRTAALGRQPGRAINLVCLLDNSGSMEREDRVSIVQQALGVLARKLTPKDRVSLVTFSRTPKLRIDGMRGGNREAFLKASTGWIPQGGTHVEKALALAYETAKKHFIPGGNNRVVLLTDGAANMGNVDPYQLRKTVESHRKQGIALDCFGVGWEGYNDNLLEVLARNGDGRYGFLNQPAQAVAEFEQKLLGAFQVAASDVKVQVEWNADRVRVFRQVGYLRHQLKKEDFRNNKIDAAEISAAESGNALYVVQVDPGGQGPLGVVRVRYKVPFTREYTELEWSLAYEQSVTPLEHAGPAMRLGCVAATFAEWLAQNPYAQGVQLADLQGLISGIPSIYATDPRPGQLEWMIGKARILAGN